MGNIQYQNFFPQVKADSTESAFAYRQSESRCYNDCVGITLSSGSTFTMNEPVVFRIVCKSGKWYETDAFGCVLRCDNGLNKIGTSMRERSSWRILGLVPIDNFGHVGRMLYLDEVAELPAGSLLYKNGKPRYTLIDVDHGTRRIHGNHTHHGVADVRKVQ